MRKLLLPVIPVLLFAAAMPARAATFSYADPEGDATGVYSVESTPMPSEPAYDITKVTMSFDGKELKYVAKIKGLPAGSPTLSTGYYFRLQYTHMETSYEFQVAESAGTGSYFALIATEDPTQDALTCSGCKGLIDRKSSSVIVTAPLKSLNLGMKQGNAAIKPAVPGTVFDSLYVAAQRDLGLLTLTSDRAAAPENSTFTL